MIWNLIIVSKYNLRLYTRLPSFKLDRRLTEKLKS